MCLICPEWVRPQKNKGQNGQVNLKFTCPGPVYVNSTPLTVNFYSLTENVEKFLISQFCFEKFIATFDKSGFVHIEGRIFRTDRSRTGKTKSYLSGGRWF